MELKGSKTEEKLREAFNRELRAQAYYHYSAAAADAEIGRASCRERV